MKEKVYFVLKEFFINIQHATYTTYLRTNLDVLITERTL